MQIGMEITCARNAKNEERLKQKVTTNNFRKSKSHENTRGNYMCLQHHTLHAFDAEGSNSNFQETDIAKIIWMKMLA